MSGGIILKSGQFRREREAGWLELESLLARAQHRGAAVLTPDELERLPLLYRSALSSLSVARAIALDRHLLLYLEDLALRAYLVVYGPRTGLLEGFGLFLKRGLPAAVRLARWHILAALLTVLAGTAAGFMLTVSDEAWFSIFVPGWLGATRGASSTRQELLTGEIFAPWPGFVDSFLVMANFLFQHNTMIGIMCFCLGFAAGVPTFLLTLYQGLMFGAFIGLHYDRGLTWEFLGWVSIHGVTEFGAIILCSAGGFLVAEKILFPDRYTRVDSLARIGGTAAHLAMGGMLLFFLAALIEGGLRQLVQDTSFRMVIGWSVGAAWMFWFSRKARP